jgi:hypothetical protein
VGAARSRDALRRWIELSRPGGRLVLIEGRWNVPIGADQADAAEDWRRGVRAAVLVEVLRPLVGDLRVEALTDPDLRVVPLTTSATRWSPPSEVPGQDDTTFALVDWCPLAGPAMIS